MNELAYDWIDAHELRRPNKLALIDLATDRRYTYGEFNARVRALAAALQKQIGVGRGDRVALLSENSSEVFEVQFACWKLGAIFLPLNWRLAAAELEDIFVDSTPKALIYGTEFEAVSKLLVNKFNLVGANLSYGDGSVHSSYEKFLNSGVGPDLQVVDSDMGDTATILYTSGTTGLPKGVLNTHHMGKINAVHHMLHARVDGDSVCLAVMPLFHTGGLNVQANPVFFAGGTVAVMRTFEPEDTIKYIMDSSLGITHMMGVPSHYLFISQHPAFETADFSNIRIAGLGGAPAALPLMQTWADKGVGLCQLFGMTETSPLVTFLDPDYALEKIGSCGQRLMSLSIRLVDDAGNDVGPNETGEIWLKGPAITPGYWNKPEATAASFRDGWFMTGDAARVDEDGFYYIVDRWKDMYISGGENVYPAEVENVLYQLPFVAETAVIGIASDRWGETGQAIIVCKPGEQPLEVDVIEYCMKKLAKFKVPSSVIFVDELPHTASGKIQKAELRKLYGDAPQ